MTTKNQALITKRTDELAASMNISDQLAGMSTPAKLIEMARRFLLLTRADAPDAAAKCFALATIFDRGN